MPVTDTEIVDWRDDFLGDDTNTPYDSVNIATLMDDEERNYRSVVRAEAENRAWQRNGHTVAYASSTSFTTPGDRTDIFIPGRRLKAVLSGPAYVYGHVKSASESLGVTTVVCQWDGKVYTSSTFTVVTDDQITVASGFTPIEGAVVEFGRATVDPMRRLRGVVTVTGLTHPFTVDFETGDPWISDLVALAPTRILVPATIDNTLSEVMLGQLSPVLYQSGFPGYVWGGTFTIELDGVSTAFDVPTPLRSDVAEAVEMVPPDTYKVAITPLGVVSGTPSGTQWTRARNNFGANLAATFRVVLPSAESGGVVKYAYVIVRDQ